MAVYTEVSDNALVEYLKLYDLGDLLSLKGIAGGVENSNFLLHVKKGTFILTLYEKRVARDDLPFFIGLMDHLAQKGFACPLPVRMKDGEALGELAGRPSAIVTFLEGMEVKHPTTDHCFMAGATMAQLHVAAGDFSIHRTNALNPAGWRPLVEANVGRADEIEPGLSSLLKIELDYLQSCWPTGLPSGVIHADLFKDNVFFLSDQLSGVIDFYFACNDLLAYDLAISINAWCFNDDLSFNRDFSKALIAGYQSVRQLASEEKLALPILARGAALRFLLTRTNDWLNVPAGALVIPHDPKPFSARLRHHNQTNGPEDYGVS